MPSHASQKYAGIVKWDKDSLNILRTPTSPVNGSEWDDVKSIADNLIHTREIILGGGAGLAAPQIGITKSIFIFTSDRTTESLTVVINPSYEPIDTDIIEGGEACFSVPLKCVTIKRWKTIRVKFQNLQGKPVETILDGFAAKVFQHEMDHLNGRLIIDHITDQVLTFARSEDFIKHIENLRLEDSKNYKKIIIN